jgi:hypothetical protein
MQQVHAPPRKRKGHYSVFGRAAVSQAKGSSAAGAAVSGSRRGGAGARSRNLRPPIGNDEP